MPQGAIAAGVAAYVVTINLLTFALFAADKRRAESGADRIPERTLLRLAALGGSPGALLASQLYRHKTRKQPFRRNLVTIVAVQTGVLAMLIYLAVA